MAPSHRLETLAPRIQRQEPEAETQLYRELNTYRYFFFRHVGARDYEDCFHDLVLSSIVQIRAHQLRNPERLAGYVRVIARGIVANRIALAVRARAREVDISPEIPLADSAENAETIAMRKQKVQNAKTLLSKLRQRDRDILIRFYLQDQSRQQICEELSLTLTQFRLFKNRAKQRLTEMCAARRERFSPGRAAAPAESGDVAA